MRWDPIKDILNIQERMSRLLHDSSQDGSNKGEWLPPVDVYETEKEVVILAELPGVSEESVDIEVHNHTLTIKGEKVSPVEKNTDSYYRLERAFGKFSRSFTLPQDIDTEQIAASIKNGVLTVTLAKSKKKKIKTIKVIKG